MKGKRPMPEQIIQKLRDADTMPAVGKSIGQMAQSLEISEQTFHLWRKQYGGMKAEEAKRLKELEQENKRLKKLVARFRSAPIGQAGKLLRDKILLTVTVSLIAGRA